MALEHINGTPWFNQASFNNSSATDITGWSNSSTFPFIYPANQTLPTVETYNLRFPSVVFGSKVYVLTPAVQVADINSSGVVGEFSDSGLRIPLYDEEPGVGDLTDFRHGGCAFITRNKVYYVGGYDTWQLRDSAGVLVNPTGTNKVYSALIGSEGDLGEFTEETYSLPAARAYGSVVVTTDRVYYFGGLDFNGTITNRPQNAVYWAPIDTEGNLGAWNTSSSALHEGLAYSTCILIGNQVYLVGGMATWFRTTTNRVYTATVDESGVVGSWTEHNTLPGYIAGAAVFSTGNRVFVLGGTDATGFASTATYSATITSSSIGSWSSGSSLGDRRKNASCFLTSSRVYLINGETRNEGFPYVPSSANDRRIWHASFAGGANDYASEVFLPATVSSGSSWAVKAGAPAQTAWSVLNSTFLMSSSAWRVLQLLSFGTGWRAKNELMGAASWGVLAGTESAATSWRVWAGATAQSSWRVLADLQVVAEWAISGQSVASTSWRVMGLVVAPTSWAVLDSLQVSTASSWAIKTIIEASPQWAIKTEGQSAASWRVFTKEDVASSFRVMALSGESQTSWAIKNRLLSESLWSVISLDYPGAKHVFFALYRGRELFCAERIRVFQPAKRDTRLTATGRGVRFFAPKRNRNFNNNEV